MNRNRLAKKWDLAPQSPEWRRTDRFWQRYLRDYWQRGIGHGGAPVPGRLLAVSKLRRKAGV